MKALYCNRLCNIVEVSADVTLVDDGKQVLISLGDEALVIDPTDAEVAGADNLREWYGLDAEGAKHLRSLLRGEFSSQSAG